LAGVPLLCWRIGFQVIAKCFDEASVLSYSRVTHGTAELFKKVHGLLFVSSIAAEEID
jgi:hypothetical protein